MLLPIVPEAAGIGEDWQGIWDCVGSWEEEAPERGVGATVAGGGELDDSSGDEKRVGDPGALGWGGFWGCCTRAPALRRRLLPPGATLLPLGRRRGEGGDEKKEVDE